MWKNLFVHLDGGDKTAIRLAAAVALAKACDARLTGVFAQNEAAVPALGSHGPGPALKAAAVAVEEHFRDAAAAAGLSTVDWYGILAIGEAYLTQRVIAAARHCDAIVMGQFDPEFSRSAVPPGLVEQVALHAARPVLVLPYFGDYAHGVTHAVLLWNGSPGAVRAVNEALPWLVAQRCRVTVMEVAPLAGPVDEDGNPLPGPSLLEHLAAHGIQAHWIATKPRDHHFADGLLSHINDVGADLVVMGAHAHYGHPRLHRGAITRHMLEHMTTPVFLVS